MPRVRTAALTRNSRELRRTRDVLRDVGGSASPVTGAELLKRQVDRLGHHVAVDNLADDTTQDLIHDLHPEDVSHSAPMPMRCTAVEANPAPRRRWTVAVSVGFDAERTTAHATACEADEKVRGLAVKLPSD